MRLAAPAHVDLDPPGGEPLAQLVLLRGALPADQLDVRETVAREPVEQCVDGTALSADESLWVVLDALLDRFAGDGVSYVQLIRGEGAPEEDELRERLAARGIEADVSWGGQPHYPLLLSAE